MSEKNKHMTHEDKQEIEDCLRHSVTFKDIAKNIGKDQTKMLQKKIHYKMFSFTRGEDLTHLLGIREIPADQVIQSPLLLKQLTH